MVERRRLFGGLAGASGRARRRFHAEILKNKRFNDYDIKENGRFNNNNNNNKTKWRTCTKRSRSSVNVLVWRVGVPGSEAAAPLEPQPSDVEEADDVDADVGVASGEPLQRRSSGDATRVGGDGVLCDLSSNQIR